jgi:hypothetical protein
VGLHTKAHTTGPSGRDDVKVLILQPGGQVQRLQQLSDACRDDHQPGTVAGLRPAQRQQVCRLSQGLGSVQPQCPRERLQHLLYADPGPLQRSRGRL